MAKPTLTEQMAMHHLLRGEGTSEVPTDIDREEDHNYSKRSEDVARTADT